MKRLASVLQLIAAAGLLLWPEPARASSHMDAPLITLDDAANTTDVYAFVSQRFGRKYLTTALAVYPHEEPGVGPNKMQLRRRRAATRFAWRPGTDRRKGRTTLAYQLPASTRPTATATRSCSRISGVIGNVGDASQNLIQRYTVDKVDWRTGRVTRLGRGIVPAEQPGQRHAETTTATTTASSRPGTASRTRTISICYTVAVDRAARRWLHRLRRPARRRVLRRRAGDLRPAEAASVGQGGRLAGRVQRPHDGVEHSDRGARRRSANRRRLCDDQPAAREDSRTVVGRQRWRLRPGGAPGQPAVQRRASSRSRTRISTAGRHPKSTRRSSKVRAHAGARFADQRARVRLERRADDEPHRYRRDLHPGSDQGGPVDGARRGLPAAEPAIRPIPTIRASRASSIFGGDTLTSTVQAGFGGGTVPGGWPNGRRFGDDVVDIAVTALISDLRVSPPIIVGPAGDNVNSNDIAYNKVFPTPRPRLNGRTHRH